MDMYQSDMSILVNMFQNPRDTLIMRIGNEVWENVPSILVPAALVLAETFLEAFDDKATSSQKDDHEMAGMLFRNFQSSVSQMVTNSGILTFIPENDWFNINETFLKSLDGLIQED